MLVKCKWKTCINNDKGMCKAEAIELNSFDYDDEEGEEKEGLKCTGYQYDRDWMMK